MKRYDFTRYVFRTQVPEALAPLVGKLIRGFTPNWGYLIQSFDGKQGIALEVRGDVSAAVASLADLPMYLHDFVEVK